MKNDREGFRLGEWQIIPEAGVFVKNGHHVHVEPKLMDLLLALIAAPGQFASREQLLSQVWPRVVINEEVLTRAVSELRTLLGDTSRERRYIVTVPKRGYRLIVQPQEHECDIGKAAAATATNSAPTSRSWPAGAAHASLGSGSRACNARHRHDSWLRLPGSNCNADLGACR